MIPAHTTETSHKKGANPGVNSSVQRATVWANHGHGQWPSTIIQSWLAK